MRALALGAISVLLAVTPLRAQARPDTARADTARPAVPAPLVAPARDTLRGPPISPKSAFVRSLLVPGLGQAALDRGTAGGIFVSIEVLSVLMTIKSKRDQRVARQLEADSIFFGFGPNGDTLFVPSPVAGRVRTRGQHVEDWLAILIFNHLIAGADAFVAAQLWDVPARVSVERDGDRTRLAATVRWE